MQFQILEICNILTSPYPIKPKQIGIMLGCARSKASKEFHNARKHAAAKGFKFNSDIDYITPEQWLDYTGWDMKKIERDAGNLFAALNQRENKQKEVIEHDMRKNRNTAKNW